MSEPRLLAVVGTRPEAIKVAPVALAARGRGGLDVELLATGQHTDILDQALSRFGLVPDHRIAPVERSGGSQSDLLAHLLPQLETAIADGAPDAVLVQGDTASALAGAMAAVWQRVPVVHLEAGLRSFDTANPFPEETYRRVIGSLASLHLAPTAAAVANLLREGIARHDILRIGNTVVDAAHHAGSLPGTDVEAAAGRRLVLLTVHRRENWGPALHDVATAVRQLVESVDDIEVVAPLHPNPLVRRTLVADLAQLDRVRLVEPLDHPDLIAHLRAATLVLTDSGGIQEEAPAFGTPVLVLRTTTERPEAVEAGCAELVGTDPTLIFGRAAALLTDEHQRQAMARVANPFGDGLAGVRTVEAVRWWLGHGPQPEEWAPPVADAVGELLSTGGAR